MIEFLAPPGSGKTTVSTIVVERLQQEGDSVSDRDTYNQRVLEILRESPGPRHLQGISTLTTARLLSLIDYLLSLQPRNADLLRRSIRFLKVLRARMVFDTRARQEGLVILDQGVLQAMLSLEHLQARGIPSPKRVGFLKAWSEFLPSVVIQLRADGEVIARRIGKRQMELGVIGELEAREELDGELLDHFTEFFDVLLQELQEAKPEVQILQFECEGPASKVADKVFQAFRD